MLNVVANFVGIIIFTFAFWRKLKEDYVTTHIFTVAFYSLIGLTLGILIADFFIPEWWFWMGILGILSGISIGVFRYKLRFYEVFESGVKGYLSWYIIFFLSVVIKSPGVGEVMMLSIGILLLILYHLLNSHYKNFSWSRSGKVGFSGLSVLGIFFLCKAVIAIYFPNMVSFSGKFEDYVSATAAFIVFLSLFNLARLKS